MNLPPVWFYRKYDTNLHGHDEVPVYFWELDADCIPRGLYFKNVPTKENLVPEPYRLDFF